MEDLSKELDRARRQPWLTRSTGIMLGLVLLVGGFLAGIKVQQGWGPTSSSNSGAGQANQQLAANFQNARGGQATGSAPTVGKIKLVDGTTVYVETADGNIITVKTTDATTVQNATPAQLKDLAPGTSVTVQGVSAGTDTVTATSVTATPTK